MRPGRFDRQVVVPVPDIKGREGILRVHSRKTILDENVDLHTLARGDPRFHRRGPGEHGQRGGAHGRKA